MEWTQERVASLTKLWADGLSASQIMAELGGVTRSAVIGKIYRLGLSGRAKVLPKADRRGDNTRALHIARRSSGGNVIPFTPMRCQPMAEPPPPLHAPQSLKLRIEQLTSTTCRWPVGDPAAEDFGFCGHESSPEKPYCPFHQRLAFVPTADRRRAR